MGQIGGGDDAEDGAAEGGEDEEGEGEDQGEAGEVVGVLELGPEEFDPEAAAFGVADLLFDPHATVVEGGDSREADGEVGGQPPGFALSFGPDSDQADGDAAVLAELDPAQIPDLAGSEGDLLK